MKTLHRITTYSATVLLLTALAACTDEERSNTPLVPTKEDIAFLGTVEEGEDITTRATVMNSEKFDYGDIYIYRERETEESGGEKKSEMQVYQVAPGEQGKLEVKESGDALKWEDAYDKQTFIAWTQPYPGSEEEEESTPPTDEDFMGGVMMNEPESPATYATTGTVKFGTQSETNLERFIVAKTGPLSFNDQNQYVGLHFYHPVGKIQLDVVTHIRSDKSEEDITEAILTFPNLPKSATLNVLNAKELPSPYTDVLNPNPTEKGITWTWKKNEENALLYVNPFTFYDDKINDDYMQPGYFTIQIKVTPNSSSQTTVTKIYSGMLATSSTSHVGAVQLKGNECLHITMQATDGPVIGINSYITDWNTEPMENVPQHPVPGIYTQEDAEALLNALLNDTDIPAYLIDGEEGETQTIRFFTHVDWSGATEDITIPEGYILDGQGYKLTLPESVNLYGVKGEGEDEAGNIKNLYVNEDEDEYTVVEEPEPEPEPDPDSKTPETEDPVEDTANT